MPTVAGAILLDRQSLEFVSNENTPIPGRARHLESTLAYSPMVRRDKDPTGDAQLAQACDKGFNSSVKTVVPSVTQLGQCSSAIWCCHSRDGRSLETTSLVLHQLGRITLLILKDIHACWRLSDRLLLPWISTSV